MSTSGKSISGRRYNSALRQNKLKYKEKEKKKKEEEAGAAIEDQTVNCL